MKVFLISSFRRVLYVVCFLLGNSPEESIQQKMKVYLTSFSHVLILSFKTHRFRIVKFQKFGITICKTFHRDDCTLVNMQLYITRQTM